MQTEAYAKVNLTLDITGRDERGYHLLSSLFATVLLSDTVTLTPGGETITMSCDWPFIPVDDRNLCIKAARCFFNELSLPEEGLHIDLKKRIPVCAGLGGGSSDAAAVIRLLCRHYGIAETDSAVHRIAVRVGADVPFFLKGGLCLAEGIGDILTPQPSLRGYTLLIAKTSERASTPDVYRVYDSLARSAALSTPSFLQALRRGEDIAPYVSNHLTEAASTLCPSVPRLKAQLISLGACAAEMSGSGSAVYGLFREEKTARKAKKLIDARFCRICRFV